MSAQLPIIANSSYRIVQLQYSTSCIPAFKLLPTSSVYARGTLPTLSTVVSLFTLECHDKYDGDDDDDNGDEKIKMRSYLDRYLRPFARHHTYHTIRLNCTTHHVCNNRDQDSG